MRTTFSPKNDSKIKIGIFGGLGLYPLEEVIACIKQEQVKALDNTAVTDESAFACAIQSSAIIH